MHLNTDNLSTTKNQQTGLPSISHYISLIKSRKQGFYDSTENNDLIEKINEFVSNNSSKYKHIVVLGIGGSSLGSICIQQSLTHLFQLKDEKTPELIVLDNIDPTLLNEVQDVISLDETLFIVITKSGGTPETLSQYLYFRNLIEEYGLNAEDHFVFITDPEKGLLRKIADTEMITSFSIPENIGGRFSVLTPVGLLPAALIGVNIKELLRGANDMKKSFLNVNEKENLPFQIAKIQYNAAKDGKSQNVMFVYNQKLIRFSDWYRQLLAESIGKEKNLLGEIMNTGITPINALGVTDQHSQAQLYNEGPNDKLFIFLSATENEKSIIIPKTELKGTKYLSEISFDKLLKTEMKATQDALKQYDRPNISISIDRIDEYNLGQLFMLFMGATAFLGEMLEIDTYNQPGVELAKNLTREYLSK